MLPHRFSRRAAPAGRDFTGSRDRLMIEMAPHGIAVLGLDGLVLDVNPAIERLLGLDRSQILGRECEPFTYPDDHVRERPLLEATLAGRRDGYTIEKRYVRSDGAVVWANLAITLIRDRHGHPLELLALIEDIDDRHKLDEALRESEARYRSIFHESGSGIALMTFDGSVVQANAALGVMLGANRQDLKGRVLGELVPPAERDASIAAPGTQVRYERRLNAGAADTTIVDVRLTALASGDLAAGYLLASVDDVTSRRVAEEERRALSETLRNLVAASPLAIVSVGREGRVQLWNEKAEAMYGWSAAEVIGRRLPTVPEEEWEALSADLAEQFGGVRQHDGREIVRRRKDGSTVEVELWTSSLRDDSGDVIAQVGFHVDTTERKRLEQQLRQSQKMDAIGRLAGSVAHDFNNLLAVIRAVTCSMLTGEPDLREREQITRIDTAAATAAELTGQLLAFSRQQARKLTTVDLNAVVVETGRLLERLIGDQVVIEIDVEATPMLTLADRTQLGQVVLNLALNAREAMPDGGTITMRTRAETQGAGVVLEVADTGIGMDEATQRHLFEPFFTTKPEGTGLGLAIVDGIVRESGGSIELESRLGLGTTIAVHLPAADAPPADDVPQADEVLTGTETILVVDDADILRALLVEIVESYGYAALAAATGREALELVTDGAAEVDVVVTDLRMPGLDGESLSRAMRELSPNVGVVFTSAEPPENLDLKQYGAAFIQKPFPPEALAKAIRAVLE